MKKIAILLLATFLLSGCGGSEDSPETTSLTVSDRTLEDFYSNDAIEAIDSSKSLDSALVSLATQTTLTEFTSVGLDLAVSYVVRDYFYSFMADYILSFEVLKGENLAKNSTILSSYMEDIYVSANSTTQSGFLWPWEDETSESTIVDKIIEAIIDYITNLIYPSEEVIVPDDTYTITPKDSYEFVDIDTDAKIYYVASDQYMTVTFEAGGLSGRGDIGFGLGADFTSYISAGKLFIDMSDIYEITKVYEDPGYCIASTMMDSVTGIAYDAFWFTNKDDYKKADDMALAESLCYIHSSEYSAPVIATDGVLEPIKDERAGHLPVAQSTTSTMVEELLNGVDNTATVTDAKYFARSMRHGVFAIYTTNNQTDTLQAKETAKVMREVLPLGASSAINMQELMGRAYDSSVAFQEEVNRDLNNSTTEINARLDAIITATSQAMDRTVSPDYHGTSDVTAFGDVVDFDTINKNISIFRNSATADVIIKIYNNVANGVEADVEFETTVKTTLIGASEVQFSDIDATSTTSYISGTDYKLYISKFNYHRANGLMTLKGNGYLGVDSRLTLSNYDVVATFVESPSLELVNFKVIADGDITTQSGRVFNGTLVFDGTNTSNSKMDGVLTGINDEPIIDGLFQTSLDVDDINGWLNDHSGLSTSIDNIGEQSYFMKVLISKDDKKIAADMLVNRDESADTWTYLIQDLLASDVNGEMKASKVYLTQKGANTLAESLEKIAVSGMSLDTDIDALINLGWDVASDFDNIGIEGLEITMKPASGDIKIDTTLHVTNNNDTMSADLNATYDYDKTHLSALGNFETVVSIVDGQNSYSNTFTTEGMIKVDNQFNYKYALDYNDINQYILFTREDSSYQMGFVIRSGEIKGADSYGVLADFTMNTSYDVLENMNLFDRDTTSLGVYDRSTDTLEIKFSDETTEYMYLY